MVYARDVSCPPDSSGSNGLGCAGEYACGSAQVQACYLGSGECSDLTHYVSMGLVLV
jgi:hypothetical protein